MRNAKIIASGMYVPENVLTNSYFNKLLDEDVDTWLRENVQIYERRWCSKNESTADLCVWAAKNILNNAGLDAKDIDLIIITTDTPEYISPSTASVVQYKIGAENAATFDINTACAGFVSALDTGSKYIQSDKNYNHILVIGAYAMSKYLNLTDKKTVTLFADGAAGVILKAEETNAGFLGAKQVTKGEYHDWMGIYAGGTALPLSKQVLENNDHKLKFVKKFPKELNPEMWSKMIFDLCEEIGIQPKDVAHFLFTQININSIQQTMKRLGLGMDKCTTVMHHYGYTGAASIPIAFHEAVTHKKIHKDDIIIFMGSGGGLAFATAAFKM